MGSRFELTICVGPARQNFKRVVKCTYMALDTSANTITADWRLGKTTWKTRIIEHPTNHERKISLLAPNHLYVNRELAAAKKRKQSKHCSILKVYHIYSCISRPPHSNFSLFRGKQMKFTPIEISQNVILFFLRMYRIKKSRGLIIRGEGYQDHNNLRTYELFDLLEKYFTIFGSESHCI